MAASWSRCLLLVALVAVVVVGGDAQQQQWRSVAALRDLTRRLEGLAADAAQQHSHPHGPDAAEDKMAAGESGEKRPVVITVVGVLLAVGFLVGVAMMLRRSHGRSEERRGVRLESPPADNDEEAELGLMAGGEHEDGESAEEEEEEEEQGDPDDRDWEEKRAVRLEDKSD